MLKLKSSTLVMFFSLFMGILFCQKTNAGSDEASFKAICMGIEVLGVDPDTARKVRKLSTLQIGDSFILSELEEYSKKTINQITNALKIEDVKTSAMVLSNGNFYFVIDVIPQGSKKVTYRTIPTGKVVQLPEELNSLYKKLNEKIFKLTFSYINVEEYYDKGFIDYKEPDLHKIADKISILAKSHNNDLLNVIHYSHDSEEREKAAHLLSWSQHPSNLRYIAKADLLLDPDNAVRNYVARSYIHFMDRVEDKSMLVDIIPAYCKMASLPHHSDRNKALYCIREILKIHPEISSSINSECKANISYIAEMSVLDNVGGTAKEILALMEKKHDA